MNIDLEDWFGGKGEEFLRSIGIKEDDIVLDVGCGGGSYSIPAAKVVGKRGLVYAVDKNKEALNSLLRRAEAEGADNIVIVNTIFPDGGAFFENSDIDLSNESVDFVLLYDILHYMTAEERAKLYEKLFGLLKNGGIMSIYPKHSKQDEPLWNLAGLNLKDVANEVEKRHFTLERETRTRLIHDERFDQGNILNFKKTYK